MLTAARLTGRKLKSGWPDKEPARPAERIDPVLQIATSSAAAGKLIGRVFLKRTPDAAAWAEIDRSGFLPLLRVHYRGLFIAGDTISRQMVGGRVTKTKQSTGCSHHFSLDDLAKAAQEIRRDLEAAGHKVGSFFEVRATQTGGVALIGLRPSRARAQTMGR